nr:MAG: replication associated protein [Cressdnaviricota sp.]
MLIFLVPTLSVTTCVRFPCMRSDNLCQSRCWIGTSYRENFTILATMVSYGISQREKCPDTGRIHTQFFVKMATRQRMSSMKKIFPGDHLEVAKCPMKAREYCRKEETRVSLPVEVGVWEEPGVSTQSVLESVRSQRVVDLIASQPSLWRNLRVLSDLRSSVAPRRCTLTRGLLFTGATGTGKTSIAARIAEYVGFNEVFWHNGSKWWQNYDQQELVIFDEYRGQFTPTETLRLLDRHPYQVEYKGGFANFNSNFVILTSNLDLERMYMGIDPATIAAIKRRLLVVNFF